MFTEAFGDNASKKHQTVSRFCGNTTVFLDTRLSKSRHPLKRFQNFRQSYSSYHIWKCWTGPENLKYGGRSKLHVNMVASYLLNLRWRVVYKLLVQGFTVEPVARLLHVGKTFVKKIWNLYQNTKTVHYQSRLGRVRKLEGIKVSLRFELRFL